MLKEGLVDATFISELRDLALKGKACFVYAGTYDIKELPKEKEFGIEGQMTNTRSMHINEIEQVYADELIDACESIVFVEKAKAYIRSLSGCPLGCSMHNMEYVPSRMNHRIIHAHKDEDNHHDTFQVQVF